MWGRGGTTISLVLRSLKVLIQPHLEVKEVKGRNFLLVN